MERRSHSAQHPIPHHVVPNGKGGWDIKRENSLRASRHFDTQQEAVQAAREMSKKAHSELIIHDKEGKIREKDSHGFDPSRSRG